MRALVTHQMQGSYYSFPTVASSWCRGNKLHHFVPSFLPVERKEKFITLKCRSRLSKGTSLALGSKSKLFKISSFKGSSRHDDTNSRSSGSKSLKNPLKVSYLQHEIKESSMESSKAQDVTPADYTAADGTTTRSQAIQNLFKNWLMLLRMPSQSQSVEEIIEEPTSVEISETQETKQNQERTENSNAVLCYLKRLDATIKIPFLIFTPLYLAVNLMYGSEVSKELTPLWILGPLIFALYIKMFRAICALYIFSFKQTFRIVKNLPVYYMLAHNYILSGQLKEAIQAFIWKPVRDVQRQDYKEVSRKVLMDLQGWLVERYLDFVESIWPYYCRTIRFLKRANLI